jgi:anti-sigma28 factor (negative regulator of flagellin synthesis)
MNSRKEEAQEKARAGKTGGNLVSLETYRRQKMARLAKQKNEPRAEMIRKLKEQIEQGTYHVDASDVAKSVVRSEITRLLRKKPQDQTGRKGGES